MENTFPVLITANSHLILFTLLFTYFLKILNQLGNSLSRLMEEIFSQSLTLSQGSKHFGVVYNLPISNFTGNFLGNVQTTMTPIWRNGHWILPHGCNFLYKTQMYAEN